MDAKKLAGVMVAFAVLVPMTIATASPEMLAFIDMALIGALYVVRRRRLAAAAAPVRRIARPATVAMPTRARATAG